MGWGSKKAAAPQPSPVAVKTVRPVVVPLGPLEEEPPSTEWLGVAGTEKPSDAAKAQLAWHKFKSSKGLTDASVAMLMYEFIASRGMFAELVKFAGRKK